MSPTLSGGTTSHPPAGLDRRFYAEMVDRVLAWAAYAAAAWTAVALHLGWAGVGMVSGLVVLVWLLAAVLTGTTGATPGKALLGLRVLDHDSGGSIGIARAALRHAILGVAGAPTIGIGLGVLAWTALVDPGGRRRGWHDVVTGARVDDVRAAVVPVAAAPDQPTSIVNLTAMRLAPEPPEAVLPTPVPAMPGPDGWAVAFDTGERLVVTGLVVVGRNPEAGADEPPATLLPLPSTDMSLSKTHAQFQVVPDGALVVMDRGSTNGSTLVREGVTRPLVARRPATLREGDVVHFGDRAMRVSRL